MTKPNISATGIFDVDCIENNGTGKVRSFLDPQALIKCYSRIEDGVAFQNRSFRTIQTLLYGSLNIECVATGENADNQIVRHVLFALDAGVRRIFLVTGDGDLAFRVCSLTSRFGASLQVACRGQHCSPTLKQFSDEPLLIIDRFVTTPFAKKVSRGYGLNAPHLSLHQQYRRVAM